VHTAIVIASFLVLGLMLGGLLTFVVGRLPVDEPHPKGRAQCAQCGHALALREMVPIASFLVQRGMCRHCRAPIPRRYMVIEVLAAAGFGILALLRFGTPGFPMLLILWLLALSASAIDLSHRVIPNRLLAGGAALVLVWLSPEGISGYLSSGEGALLLFVIGLVIALVGRGGFGLGDVKYLAVVGLALGPTQGMLALFLAIVLGGLYAVGLIVMRRAGRNDTFAFGPFIAAASVAAPLISAGVLLPNGH
jgi:prepilin signal peptidase PulO-like enzyme (type II secretory pathway)